MNPDYLLTIGLEVHAELKTVTKMFCRCKNDPDEKRPNMNICPVCMAHPGTLPVINKEAVRHILRMGAAVGGKQADYTEFDRKNYFYPDIPKGYQISQYKFPLISGGELSGVAITRVHLEEDTARSSHETGEVSLVDFNRAGLPLMELVTEPVIHSAEQAVAFAKELQLLLRYLGAGEANMEKGQMRVEANISVAKAGERGTKVEVKNLNSFRSVERAILYEMKRQVELIESGGKVVQETRGWDEHNEKTFSQRLKEDSHDYRYFPDPDLPKLALSQIPEFEPASLKKGLPELPWERKNRLERDYGIQGDHLEMYRQNKVYTIYLDEVAKHFKGDKDLVKLASNYITSDLVGILALFPVYDQEGLEKSSELFAKLIRMVRDQRISSRAAKDLLQILFSEECDDPEKIAEEKGWIQKNDEDQLKAIVDKVIEMNPKIVQEYKGGKTTVIQFFVGQGMKESKGSANPEVLRKLFTEALA